MEKLVMLIDDYEELIVGVHSIGDKVDDKETAWIISKQFGFIKWLVDNDKVDRERILKENGQFRLFYYDLERVKNYDRLVMYLSVEDNPIEFLISVLK